MKTVTFVVCQLGVVPCCPTDGILFVFSQEIYVSPSMFLDHMPEKYLLKELCFDESEQ